jgi:hypothetical protein
MPRSAVLAGAHPLGQPIFIKLQANAVGAGVGKIGKLGNARAKSLVFSPNHEIQPSGSADEFPANFSVTRQTISEHPLSSKRQYLSRNGQQ